MVDGECGHHGRNARDHAVVEQALLIGAVTIRLRSTEESIALERGFDIEYATVRFETCKLFCFWSWRSAKTQSACSTSSSESEFGAKLFVVTLSIKFFHDRRVKMNDQHGNKLRSDYLVHVEATRQIYFF